MHPHAGASHEIVPLDAGGFGVRVSIPDTSPTTVSRFDTEAAAAGWIAAHKNPHTGSITTRNGIPKIQARDGRIGESPLCANPITASSGPSESA